MKKAIRIALLFVPMTLWFVFMMMTTIFEMLCEGMMELADTIETKINK